MSLIFYFDILLVNQDKQFQLHFFLNEKLGWIVGQFGEILHTKDGGANWKFQRSDTENNLNKIFFGDANHGLAVGDDGVVLTTTSGGKKWDIQESETKNDLYNLV